MNDEKILSIKEVQYVQKEMLKEIIKFFKENNLNYYIWAGSLLGAVRHKGFIPWDDDIDLAMLRPDYDKLITYLKNHNKKIKDNLEAISLELDNSDYPFLKIINVNYKYKL